VGEGVEGWVPQPAAFASSTNASNGMRRGILASIPEEAPNERETVNGRKLFE